MEHKGTVTLETPRLILRRLTLADAEPMYRNWASDPGVTKFLTWPTHSSVEVTKQILALWASHYEELNYYQWGIVVNDENALIGTIAAVKTDDEIKAAYDKMSSVSGVRYDGMPHVRNLHAAEDRIINAIDEIDVLKERYRQAVEYMDWFVPAWEQLSEDDRYVLDTFYSEDNEYGSSVVDDIAEYFHIERASAYRRKNRAIDKLTVLLFGKP